jgi:membrane protease subunit HflK
MPPWQPVCRARVGRGVTWPGQRCRAGHPGRTAGSANNGRNDGPPDLDELWRDFNRKLSGLFGGKGRQHRGRRDRAGGAAGPATSSPT